MGQTVCLKASQEAGRLTTGLTRRPSAAADPGVRRRPPRQCPASSLPVGPALARQRCSPSSVRGAMQLSQSPHEQSSRNVAPKGKALVLRPSLSPRRSFVVTLRSTTPIQGSPVGSSLIAAPLRLLACFTRLLRLQHLSSTTLFEGIHSTHPFSSYLHGRPSTQPTASATIPFLGWSTFTTSSCGGTVRAATPSVRYLACRLPHVQSSSFMRSSMAPPNPSLQPTSYGWLRQPTQAAELKRSAHERSMFVTRTTPWPRPAEFQWLRNRVEHLEVRIVMLRGSA